MRCTKIRCKMRSLPWLKRYSLHNPAAPASLQDLVPRFLATAPIDYMDGKPVKYRLRPDGSALLYSIGDDGSDDGGNSEMRPGQTSKRDIWARKDVVWPSSALPEEIEAYRAAQSRD